jgi:PadR family transcriptional regulator, regulatory protein AphA
MSLRFALLAVLSAEPMTGYDLLQFFDTSVGFIWHAPHSNIYPELRRMEGEGLLDSDELPRGERGVKRLYSVTERGFEELHAQASRVMSPARERDPYRLRSAYLEWAAPSSARAQLQAHLEHFERWGAAWASNLEEIRGRSSFLLAKRLARAKPADHDAIVAFKEFAYEGLVERAQLEVSWARRGLALIDRLEAAGWSGPPSPAGGRDGSMETPTTVELGRDPDATAPERRRAAG